MDALKYFFQRFINADIEFLLLGFSFGIFLASLFWRFVWWNKRKNKFKSQSRSVLKGLITEQFAPLLPGFKYNLSDARFIGNPVDFIIFNGLHDGTVREIIFIEVKSNRKTSLTNSERHIRDAIMNGKVRWELYRMDF